MRSLLALLLALGLSIPVGAAETIEVAGEQKFAQGLLRGVEHGDVACYLTLEDDAGEPFTELAEFELCESATSLIDKPVQLHYTTGSVIAESCQGDPECTQTQTAILVDRIEDAAPRKHDADGPTHCSAVEFEVFGCTVAGDKLVSVCADAQGKPKLLQYRFGKLDVPELFLPAAPYFPQDSVYGRNDAYSGGGASWLRFRNGAFRYIAYSGIGRWGPDGATVSKSGVAVEKNGTVIANLPCVNAERSALSPEWFEQAGFDPTRDEEFFISNGDGEN